MLHGLAEGAYDSVDHTYLLFFLRPILDRFKVIDPVISVICDMHDFMRARVGQGDSY